MPIAVKASFFHHTNFATIHQFGKGKIKKSIFFFQLTNDDDSWAMYDTAPTYRGNVLPRKEMLNPERLHVFVFLAVF